MSTNVVMHSVSSVVVLNLPDVKVVLYCVITRTSDGKRRRGFKYRYCGQFFNFSIFIMRRVFNTHIYATQHLQLNRKLTDNSSAIYSKLLKLFYNYSKKL